jgi:hypothetical protein
MNPKHQQTVSGNKRDTGHREKGKFKLERRKKKKQAKGWPEQHNVCT